MKRFYDRKFWMGFHTALLVVVVNEFFKGAFSWKETMLYGSMLILMLGIDKLFLQREKD